MYSSLSGFLQENPHFLTGVKDGTFEYIGKVETLLFTPFLYKAGGRVYLAYTHIGELVAPLAAQMVEVYLKINSLTKRRVGFCIYARRYNIAVATLLEYYDINAYLYLPRHSGFTITRLVRTGLTLSRQWLE